MKVQEWLNWHAWKACNPLKGFGGSNPPLSAEIKMNESWNKYLTLSFSFKGFQAQFLSIFNGISTTIFPAERINSTISPDR